MPNHVTNRVIVSGPVEDVAAFKKLMIVEDKERGVAFLQQNGTDVGQFDTFDFNQIIPMPPILMRIKSPIELGPNGRVMLTVPGSVPWSSALVEATPEEQAEVETVGTIQGDYKSLNGLLGGLLNGTNFHDWYSWSLANWDTKWNAYDYEPVSDHARFEFKMDTAWSAPNRVYDELAKRFPNLEFNLSWFDEGWGFAGLGSLGHCATTGTSEDFYTDATDKLYEHVYGAPPPREDDDLIDDTSLWLNLLTQGGSEYHLRLADNSTCYDVGAAMDGQGVFPLSSVWYSDDPPLDDDIQLALRNARDQMMQTLGI